MFVEISKEFVIDARTRQPSCSMDCGHSHQFNELYFLFDGDCDVWIDNTCYSLHSGMFIFIPAYLEHRLVYHGTLPIHRVVLYISTNQIETYFNNGLLQELHELYNFHTGSFSKKTGYQIEAITQKIQFEKYSKDAFSTHLTKALFYELIIIMLRCRTYKKEIDKKTNPDNIKNALILKYIDEHYTEELTLPSVAKHFSLSESSFSRKFKSFTGKNFKEYVNHLRIESSKHYLVTTNKDITEIAFLCGYHNSHRYGDVFKQLVGISPGQYRKLCP